MDSLVEAVMLCVIYACVNMNLICFVGKTNQRFYAGEGHIYVQQGTSCCLRAVYAQSMRRLSTQEMHRYAKLDSGAAASQSSQQRIPEQAWRQMNSLSTNF